MRDLSHGSKLAIAVDRPAPLPPEITVASVATGSERTWVWQGKGWIGDFMESFLRDPLRADLQIREFSAATGKVLRVAGHWRYIGAGGGEDILWTNPSGSSLVVVAPDTSPFGHLNLRSPPWAVGVLAGGQFTPLPHAVAHYTGEIAW